MAKSAKKRSSRSSDTMDKIAKAAMSKEMLAAGLAAAAAAISASPSARRKIRDAGLDAADSASGTPALVLPAWPELTRVVEDCRI